MMMMMMMMMMIRMMIFYIGKEANDGLELDFVFSIGNLNNEDGIIPRNELEIIDKGTRQAEKLINWMVPRVKKRLLPSEAKNSRSTVGTRAFPLVMCVAGSS